MCTKFKSTGKGGGDFVYHHVYQFIDNCLTCVATVGHNDNMEEKSHIVNGQYAEYGEFPHIAMVLAGSDKFSALFFCAGSLIHRYNLTVLIL